MEKGVKTSEEVDGKALLEESERNFKPGRGSFGRTFGLKEVTFLEIKHDQWMAICECNVFDCCLVVPLTVNQVSELSMPRGERRAIREILNGCPEVGEIFISGTTPAEFDTQIRGKAREKKVYEKMGYVFEEEEIEV